jgi:hypothetical protein
MKLHQPAVQRPRLFATYYFVRKPVARQFDAALVKREGTTSTFDNMAWDRIGHAASARGAARAAFTHLFDQHYEYAMIHGEDGVVLGFLERRTKSSIRCVGV